MKRYRHPFAAGRVFEIDAGGHRFRADAPSGSVKDRAWNYCYYATRSPRFFRKRRFGRVDIRSSRNPFVKLRGICRSRRIKHSRRTAGRMRVTLIIPSHPRARARASEAFRFPFRNNL